MSEPNLALLEAALLLAGGLHFALLLASFSAPRVLRWHEELLKVDFFTRQVILVHGAFIALMIIGFGAVTLFQAAEMLRGSTLGAFLAGFIGLFWLGRLAVQLFYYQPGRWLTTAGRKLGYRALTVLFAYFTVVYLTVAVVNASGT